MKNLVTLILLVITSFVYGQIEVVEPLPNLVGTEKINMYSSSIVGNRYTLTLNNLKGWFDTNAVVTVFDDISSFSTYDRNSTFFFIKDSLRGGIFKLVNSNAAADNGTIFNSGIIDKKFIRIYSDFIYPEWFGAVGDGITDDKDAIQLAMYHPNVNIRFKEGKEYFLRERVFVSQNKNIDLNGAKITINTGASPTNMVFYLRQNVLSSSTFTQVAPILAGQIFILLPSGVASNFTAGDRISVELGEDPFDPATYHYGFNTKINRISGDTIFIDRAFEYSINLTSKLSKIEKITGVDFVNIKNGLLEYGS